jgi:hypothetical protein
MTRIARLVVPAVFLGLTLGGCGKCPASDSPLSPVSTPLPDFGVGEPVVSGDEVVVGFGPPGLPIRLYDIGETGDLLGSGVLDRDGRFAVEVSGPLRVGQRVGLALGDLKGTDFSIEALRAQAIIELPVIGPLFADVPVQAR